MNNLTDFEQQCEKAADEGFNYFYKTGMSYTNNPYPQGSDLADWWLSGYEDAVSSIGEAK